MVRYRPFCNFDPPLLVDLWNESFTGRGAVHLSHSSPLERHAFAKLYFDPEGLIVADEGHRLVGFAHAGFGPNEDGTALSTETGVICAIAVRPGYRRKGIATELLRQCEDYLRQRGARTIVAGPQRPLNPFYMGMYGGSNSPGFLASDADAAPFLEMQHYQGGERILVFQRRLDEQINIPDGRFPGIRAQYEMKLWPRIPVMSWWQECVLGLIEPVEFRLVERGTDQVAARARAWEMEGFSWRWNQPAVGILDVFVEESLRRRGLGKFLGAQILRYLQEQFFGVAEIQVAERDTIGIGLVRDLGFMQVDSGLIYRKM